METQERKSLIRKGRIDRLKTAITNILSNDTGLDFLIKLRKLGMVNQTPVSVGNKIINVGDNKSQVVPGSNEETYYYCGRHAVINEVMEMLRLHDFQGYIRLLQYEQNLKQRKDDG